MLRQQERSIEMLQQLLLAELSGSVEADDASPVPADRDPGAIVELGELVDFNANLVPATGRRTSAPGRAPGADRDKNTGAPVPLYPCCCPRRDTGRTISHLFHIPPCQYGKSIHT
ncbi:hypothetical protein [Glutamicibacter mysorens]|nr:hypothetical protein [Glutamicibacter mysorens]